MYKSNIAQKVAFVEMTSTQVAAEALNQLDAAKAAGAFHDHVFTLAVNHLVDSAKTTQIDDQVVVKAGIRHSAIPFGCVVSLTNGVGRQLVIIRTSFGTQVVEKNSGGWSRRVNSLAKLRSALIAFTGNAE